MKPPWIFSTISSPPTTSAPASWRFLLLLAAGDGEHALGLAQAVRQHDGAAHHLVGVLGIDAEPQRQLDGLVELRELDFLHERDRLFDRVGPIGGDLRAGGREFLAVLLHDDLLWCKRALRALPLVAAKAGRRRHLVSWGPPSVATYPIDVQPHRPRRAGDGLDRRLRATRSSGPAS